MSRQRPHKFTTATATAPRPTADSGFRTASSRDIRAVLLYRLGFLNTRLEDMVTLEVQESSGLNVWNITYRDRAGHGTGYAQVSGGRLIVTWDEFEGEEPTLYPTDVI